MSDRNRKRALIAAAAAAVVLVITGTTLAVTLGGDDDAPTATGSPSTDDTGEVETPAEPPSLPELTEPSEPTEPTEPAPTAEQPTTPATPDTSGLITGDADGDGLGDLSIGLIGDPSLIFPSDGSSLGDPVAGPTLSFPALSGDVDNDGALDLINIDGDLPRLRVSIAGQRGTPSLVRIPDFVGALGTSDLDLSLGDVSGDGNLDLVVGARIDDDVLRISVAPGGGDGSFAPPTTWFEDDLIDGSLVIADVDGDGAADLGHFERGLRDDTDAMMTLLRSTGSAFEVTGSPTVVDVGGFAYSSLMTGDVDGDGLDEIVVFAGYGPKIIVWQWNGTGFDQVPFFDNSDTLDPGEAWTGGAGSISDVNGDGFGDLVHVRLTKNFDRQNVEVFLSDGLTLSPAPAWTRRLDIGDSLSYTVITPEYVRLGT